MPKPNNRTLTSYPGSATTRRNTAVLVTYRWPHDLTNEQILKRLLALNLEYAQGGKTEVD
jgi:hypothetical protein